jgi:hypothetical protein
MIAPKGLFFSELLDGDFDLSLIETPVLVERKIITKKVMLMIKK